MKRIVVCSWWITVLATGCTNLSAPEATGAAQNGPEGGDATAAAPAEPAHPPLVIDESGAGGVFQVVPGQQVILHLAGSASDSWDPIHAATSTPFAEPAREFVPGERVERAGEPSERKVRDYDHGTHVLTWTARGQLDMPLIGPQQVELEYHVRDQSAGNSLHTTKNFGFTLDLVGITSGIVIDESGHGGTFAVTSGERVYVMLPAPVASLSRWFVVRAEGLGAPEVTTASGTTVMAFATEGRSGRHEIVLEYRLPDLDNATATIPGEPTTPETHKLFSATVELH